MVQPCQEHNGLEVSALDTVIFRFKDLAQCCHTSAWIYKSRCYGSNWIKDCSASRDNKVPCHKNLTIAFDLNS